MSVSEQDDLAALGCILGHLFNAMKTEDGANLIRLQGILSQLPRSVLGPYSVYRDTIRLFAKRFPDRIVAAKDKVYTSAGLWKKLFGKKHRKPAGQQQHLASGDAPGELHNVAGKVSKLLMLYGFIDLEPPHRVSIFFDKRFFDGNRHYDLTKSWLKVGDHVLLNAVRSPPGYRAKYQATRIEVAKKNETEPCAESDVERNGWRRDLRVSRHHPGCEAEPRVHSVWPGQQTLHLLNHRQRGQVPAQAWQELG
uniref:Uncharacterized protein n=1 Tax=Rhipicephalus zambeziensis TaxID=60191 RepID=A0A224YAL2_9ACAR